MVVIAQTMTSEKRNQPGRRFSFPSFLISVFTLALPFLNKPGLLGGGNLSRCQAIEACPHEEVAAHRQPSMPNVPRSKVFHKRNTQCDLGLAFLLLSRAPITIVVNGRFLVPLALPRWLLPFGHYPIHRRTGADNLLLRPPACSALGESYQEPTLKRTVTSACHSE